MTSCGHEAPSVVWTSVVSSRIVHATPNDPEIHNGSVKQTVRPQVTVTVREMVTVRGKVTGRAMVIALVRPNDKMINTAIVWPPSYEPALRNSITRISVCRTNVPKMNESMTSVSKWPV